jgi:hypothetical protein
MVIEKGEERAKYEWCAIGFVKDAFWSLNFTNHTNYTISVAKYFSNSILV